MGVPKAACGGLLEALQSESEELRTWGSARGEQQQQQDDLASTLLSMLRQAVRTFRLFQDAASAAHLGEPQQVLRCREIAQQVAATSLLALFSLAGTRGVVGRWRWRCVCDHGFETGG